MSKEKQNITGSTQTMVAENGRAVRTTSPNVVMPSAHSSREVERARRGLLDFDEIVLPIYDNPL